MYAGQFLSLILSVWQHLRNLTVSRSTRVRSFKSKTMGRSPASDLNSVFNSSTCSASNLPLSVKITCPFADLLIFSICPLFRSRFFSRNIAMQSWLQSQAVEIHECGDRELAKF